MLDFAREFLELAAVEEEFAGPERIVIPRAAGTVLGDVAILQPDFAAADFGVGLAEGAFAFAEGLDLSAGQDHAGFELVQDEVVVGGGAVLGDDFYAFGFFFGGGFHEWT